jgi:RNA polymerase sigma-70 factor (ECF subfamily)
MLLFDAVLVREANRPEGARLEALQHCLEKVSEESRVMLNLRYADNLGCETIASQMHLSLVAVYKRLSRLHGVLRDCVERRLGSNLDGGIAE